MTGLRFFVVAIVGLLTTAQAFTVVPPCTTTTKRALSGPLYSFERQKRGLAKPAVKIGQKTAVQTKTVKKVQVRKKDKTDDPVYGNNDDDFQDSPMYKVVLIGDSSYDTEHVVERACAIIEDMDENRATHVVETAIEVGKATFGKYPLESAEMYKEQLIRSDPTIYADVEDENKQ